MLQPRKTKFRKAFKGRLKGNAKGGTDLNFGSYGLKAMEPDRVTARQIEAARRAITRHIRRQGRLSSGSADLAPVRRVLVVDDEPVNVKLVQRALLRAGIDEVVGADDGSAAVELLVSQGERFDVVLIDEQMRVMNGTVAIAALRAHEAKMGLPPACVIVTTGNASDAEMQLCARAGFDGVQSKPLCVKTLASDLADLLRARRRAEEFLDFSKEGCGRACERLAAGAQARYGEIVVWAWDVGTATRHHRDRPAGHGRLSTDHDEAHHHRRRQMTAEEREERS